VRRGKGREGRVRTGKGGKQEKGTGRDSGRERERVKSTGSNHRRRATTGGYPGTDKQYKLAVTCIGYLCRVLCGVAILPTVIV
jgi:hypothetical protein